MPHHVILGGGPAALAAIDAIRLVDGGAGKISLISAEPIWDRMAMPRWLAGTISRAELFPCDDAYFAERKVDRYVGQPATRINPRANTVTIKGGQILPFDTMLIATGAAPIVPQFPGVELPGVQPLWTLAHADALLAAESPQLVCVGADWDALKERGWPVQRVDSAAVQEIKMVENQKQVVRTSGDSLPADFVILAVGLRSNVGLAKAAGIAVGQGIQVNERMQTNFPHIFAAGDVVQVQESPATAREQGRVAGVNLAGGGSS